MAKRWDADEVTAKFQFNIPTYLVYFVAGIAISRLNAFSFTSLDWAKPILYGVYGVWLLLATLCGLSCYMNHAKGEPIIQRGEAITIFVLSSLLIIASVGVGLEDFRVNGNA